MDVARENVLSNKEDMPRKEVYCEACGSNQPMVEHELRKDELNPYPWYDITCGTCYSVIATIQIVPDDKPLEPSEAMESTESIRS